VHKTHSVPTQMWRKAPCRPATFLSTLGQTAPSPLCIPAQARRLYSTIDDEITEGSCRTYAPSRLWQLVCVTSSAYLVQNILGLLFWRCISYALRVCATRHALRTPQQMTRLSKLQRAGLRTRFARRSNQSQQQPDDLQGNWISIGVALRPGAEQG